MDIHRAANRTTSEPRGARPLHPGILESSNRTSISRFSPKKPSGTRAAAFAAVLTLMLGCEQRGDQPERRATETVIAVIAEAQDDLTWPVVRETARLFESRHRRVVVKILAPELRSPRDQRDLLEGILSSDVRAVCIIPTDGPALRSTVGRLVTGGVPIVTFGRDMPQSSRRAYYGPGPGDLGRTTAVAAIAAVRNDARTLMLLHAGKDDPVYGLVLAAFRSKIAQEGSKQILRAFDCRRNRSEAVRLVRHGSRKSPSAGLWVFLDDWPFQALPAAETLVPPGCPIVLAGGSPHYSKWIKDGRIAAMIVYDFREALAAALSAALQLSRGQTGLLTVHNPIPAEIVTVDNLAEYQARWRPGG